MDVLLGVVVVALELVPTFERMFSNDTPQGYIGQPRHVSPSNHVPVKDANDLVKPGLRPEEFGPRLQV